MPGIPAKTIVVPVDFSDASIEAVDTALVITDQPSTIHVIHVLPELTLTEMDMIRGTLDDEVRKEHATKALRERLSDAKYGSVQFALEIGDPGQCIVDFAKSIEADLIVTPSHGRTGIKRLLIGSVAERVVRLAHCPVLVLRK